MRLTLALVLAIGATLVSASPAPTCESTVQYFPDSNCNNFWECSSGVAYKMSCPSGLEWNPTYNVCDWPAQAGCTGKGWSTTTVRPTRPSSTTTTEKPRTRSTTAKHTTTKTTTTAKPTTTTKTTTTRRPWTLPTLPTRSTTTKAPTTTRRPWWPTLPTRSTTTRRPWWPTWRPRPPVPNPCKIWWWLPQCRRWAENA